MGVQPSMLRSLSRSAPALRAAQTRMMATEAPLRLHGLDGRYATSLWKVASEKSELAAVEADLNGFKGCMGESGYAESTQNFFSVLAENGRLNEFENISAKFEELQRAAKGELHAEVTVADELTAAQKKSLEKSLNAFMDKGQKLSLSVTVNPEILGGLVVNIGDKHINMSIQARIQQLQNVLAAPM